MTRSKIFIEHRKIKYKDICGKCGAKMSGDKGKWICPNKYKGVTLIDGNNNILTDNRQKQTKGIGKCQKVSDSQKWENAKGGLLPEIAGTDCDVRNVSTSKVTKVGSHNSSQDSPADKQILNEHDKTCLCPKNKRQNEKILWTAEEIYYYIENDVRPLVYTKQFLDADEVKRIIEKLQPCYKGNTKYQLLEYLLKRLGLDD